VKTDVSRHLPHGIAVAKKWTKVHQNRRKPATHLYP